MILHIFIYNCIIALVLFHHFTAKGDSKAATANGTPEAKTRRQWELWSSMDKDLFFEALNEV